MCGLPRAKSLETEKFGWFAHISRQAKKPADSGCSPVAKVVFMTNKPK
jgi:hypothetical protein